MRPLPLVAVKSGKSRPTRRRAPWSGRATGDGRKGVSEDTKAAEGLLTGLERT